MKKLKCNGRKEREYHARLGRYALKNPKDPMSRKERGDES